MVAALSNMTLERQSSGKAGIKQSRNRNHEPTHALRAGGMGVAVSNCRTKMLLPPDVAALAFYAGRLGRSTARRQSVPLAIADSVRGDDLTPTVCVSYLQQEIFLSKY